MTGPVPGIDLDELAMQLHDAFFATEHSGLMGMDLWRSVAQRLPLLAAVRALRDREARVRAAVADDMRGGYTRKHQAARQVAVRVLRIVDGDR